MNITEFIKSKRVYLDGAIGTELIRNGLNSARADYLNVENPDAIRKIAESYLDAGSDIVFTNTFGCNILKLKCSELELEKIITSAISVTKSAVCGRADKFVGYSAGPLSELMFPYGRLTFDEVYRQYEIQAKAIIKNPPDFIVLETFTDVWMLKAALLAFKENTNLPVWCSMSFNDNGRSFSGASVESYALIAGGMGADVLGINCGFGPDKMLPLAKRLTAVASVPVYIKPNAGLPVYKNGKTFYDISAERFAEYMKDVAEVGVSMLGGCCGTTPEYVEKTIAATTNIPYKFFKCDKQLICSGTEVVEIKPFVKIGERLNPTGKPTLKKALVEKNLDYVLSVCSAQLEKGAQVLDVNVGTPGVDELTLLPEVITAVQTAVNCPLMLDTSNREAMKNALRIVNGVPVINSVNGDDDCLDELLPLAAKYGAYLVAICLDKNGIPETVEGRIAIARHIIDKAKGYGIDKSRFLFDALTLAVSVNAENANITLQTVKTLNSMGLNTVLGLSNVSFGLPAREVINGAFLTLGKNVGLTAAIINPTLSENNDAHALKLLQGNDENCEGYIAAYSNYEAPKISSTAPSIFECIVKGLKQEGLACVKEKATPENYFDIINNDIIAALNEVGARYESGRAFLPQLIISAEAASASLNYVKNKYIGEGCDDGDTMLILTVRGDIHDIGKNIVKAVLSNYGYKIFDLGRDVAVETVLENVKQRKPKIVGLSALMTTSLAAMRETVAAVKAYDKSIIVMVGGAVVTQEFADEIGADVYSIDAQDAVRRLKEFKA